MSRFLPAAGNLTAAGQPVRSAPPAPHDQEYR
jgi:hypothetical protein